MNLSVAIMFVVKVTFKVEIKGQEHKFVSRHRKRLSLIDRVIELCYTEHHYLFKRGKVHSKRV